MSRKKKERESRLGEWWRNDRSILGFGFVYRARISKFVRANWGRNSDKREILGLMRFQFSLPFLSAPYEYFVCPIDASRALSSGCSRITRGQSIFISIRLFYQCVSIIHPFGIKRNGNQISD